MPGRSGFKPEPWAGMDLTGWLEYFVHGLATQLQEVKTHGERAIRADVLAAEQKLNARPAALVSAFMAQTRLSLADCEALLPDVARRTVQRDLKALVERGLVRELGQGPTDPTRQYQWAGAEL